MRNNVWVGPVVLVLSVMPLTLGAPAGHAGGALAARQHHGSGISAVAVEEVEDVGRFGGMSFERIRGQVEGRVHRSEPVAGLAALLGDAEFHHYRSQFEIIRPVGAQRRRVVVVEVENRGSPLLLQALNRFVIGFSGPPDRTTYPAGLGDGFLFVTGRSYARVQWQTGIAPGVPETAQGVGEVIVRDFGAMLRSGRTSDGRSALGRYRTLILAGWSQSGWFVNTFVAEGFNARPDDRRRVFDGALVLASAGNWLPINKLGDDGQPQQPYVRPDGRPLPASRILTRSRSDPYLVDLVTYTDFYRLRAALARDPDPPRRSRRYELPAPHLPAAHLNDGLVFDTLGCNDKQRVPISPLDFRPYLRAALVGLEAELGSNRRHLPPSITFRLGGQPESSRYFNDLPDSEVRVPRLDRDGQPIGGVRLPDVDQPLGRLEPAALPPVTTAEITAICGNVGGYQPFRADELQRRYGTAQRYKQRVRPVVERLIRQRLLLPRDRDWVIAESRERFKKLVAP